MPPVVIGGALAAAGAVGGAAIASSGAKKAAKAQANAAADSTAAQERIYSQNAATLAPYVQAGIPATGMINALLGIPSAQPATAYAGPEQAAVPQVPSGGGGMWNTDAMQQAIANAQASGFMGMSAPTVAPGAPAAPVPQGTVGISQPTAQQAFDNYLNSTGYQFQLGQGMKALDSKFGGMGSFKSGAAVKAANDYAMNMGKGYFNDYLAALGNQQALGLSAASAQAGVGQNYANSLAAINANRADAMSNAALIKASTTGNALNSLGQIGAGLFNSGGGGGVNTSAMWNTSSALPGFTPSTIGAGQTGDWRTW